MIFDCLLGYVGGLLLGGLLRGLVAWWIGCLFGFVFGCWLGWAGGLVIG